jgi:hypothetical protein
MDVTNRSKDERTKSKTDWKERRYTADMASSKQAINV